MNEKNGAEITLELLKKYDRPGPRYTSYPTAVEFHEAYTEADYRASLAEASRAVGEPLSLYVHLPFCRERCSFCGCNVVITRKREVAAEYLDYLHREIDLLAASLPGRRRLSQYHWGGGTPTYQNVAEMEALQRKVLEHFSLEPDAEVAIETDPRVTTREQMDLIKRLGFNRVSMGVQDFTPEVQAAIHRNQTEAETREHFDHCRALGFHSINIDLIYGLPLQTPEAFDRSLDIVLDMRPDRVAVYSYAYVPWIKANQRKLDAAQLPSPETKLRLFCIARERFLGAGYVPIGMDHFALPDDELALAVRARRLHRNFMGYTVKMGTDMIGVGVSAIGDIRGCYAQNVKKLSTYYRALDEGKLPIERGYRLDRDDLIRRHVISRIMCNFHLDRDEVEARFGIDFADYFATELAALTAPDGPVRHGFLELRPESLEVVGNGRLFVRNIAMVFDRHLRGKKGDKPIFSRTV